MSEREPLEPELGKPPHSEREVASARAKGLPLVAVSSVVAAASGYVVFIIAARVLSQPDNADFLAFWGVLFGIFGVLSGLMNESTRAVKSRVLPQPAGSRSGAHVVGTSLLIGSVLALLVAVSSPWWSRTLIPDAPPWLWLGLALATLLYSGHAAMAGASAGLERWHTYSALSMAEALFRLLAVVVLALVLADLGGLELAALFGTVVWLAIVLGGKGGRLAFAARADVPRGIFIRRCLYAMLTAAATAVLITAFPALIKLTSDPAEFATAAPLLLAVSLTRAPILIPLQAFQGVLMTALIGSTRILAVLRKPLLGIVGLTVVGSIAAYFVGPWIMLIFGSGYALPGIWIALLTADAGLLAVLTMTGTTALALSRHGIYLSGWAVASVVSCLGLFLPMPLESTVVLSLAIGPLCGTAVHAFGIARNLRSHPRPSLTVKGR